MRVDGAVLDAWCHHWSNLLPELSMRALVWIGVVLLALGFLAWIVFKVAIKIAIFLFVAGVILMVWGAFKARRAL